MTPTVARTPLNALGRAAADERAELHAAVARVIDSGWYLLGPETEAFELEFAEYVGARHCVAVGNGTDALELALLAVGVGAGDHVATVANAGGYATTAITKLGAQPLFVDVDDTQLLMTATTLSAALPAHDHPVRAVVVTHLYGQLAELGELAEVCRTRGVPLIEDCAQAAGTTRDGVAAGRVGTLGTYSFYPTKNLGALGDGGALITDDGELAERLRRLRQYGWDTKYRAVLPGGRNSRMDELQAAVLRARLPRLPTANAARRAIVARYAAALAAGRQFVHGALDETFAAHLAVFRTPTRDVDRAWLADAGIDTDVHYPTPDYRQPALRLPRPPVLDVTDRATTEVLTVPCFPQLTDDEIDRICTALGTLP